MKLIHQKFSNDEILATPITYIPLRNKLKHITHHNINDFDKQQIVKWTATPIDINQTYNNAIEDINNIIRNFMLNHNITLPNDFNEDLILFLYNNSLR